jgi:hypothetical protein
MTDDSVTNYWLCAYCGLCSFWHVCDELTTSSCLKFGQCNRSPLETVYNNLLAFGKFIG